MHTMRGLVADQIKEGNDVGKTVIEEVQPRTIRYDNHIECAITYYTYTYSHIYT